MWRGARFFWFLLCLVAPAAAQQSTPADSDVDLEWGVKIPLRDGVHLNAAVYRPHGQSTPLPVIFFFTPYVADDEHASGLYFARRGYVFVVVDIRGRGNSEGRFEPEANEANDGYDVVEWLARQPWSSGKVGMGGGSYEAFAEWATLKGFPPHLLTIVPVAAIHPGVDNPFKNGVFRSYQIQWLTWTSGVTRNDNIGNDDAFWRVKFHELYTHRLPFAKLDSIAGNLSTTWQRRLAHPTPDPYWGAMTPTSEDYRRITIPILTITGAYDVNYQLGALTYYQRHMRYGTAAAKAQHYLIIGPWDHAATFTQSVDVGGLHFGPASVLDPALSIAWYDWTLKDGPKPDFLRGRVAYYVMGEERWKYADSLEAIAPTRRRLYLTSGADGANDAFRSGRLVDQSPVLGAADDRYVYDPLDTLPGSLEMAEIPNSLTDERSALNLFGDGLVYHSAPFGEDTEVSGYVTLVLWLSLDARDADFRAMLYEIRPDGQSVYLTSDILRARYRDSPTAEHLLKPGEIDQYEFRTFNWFARRIARGSRLRLVVTCPNSIYWEKNYGTGGVVALESGANARPIHVTLYHDREHPSYLEIPVAH